MTWKSLRIVVTRPKPQGEELCKKIEAKGAKAIYFPVIDIFPPDDDVLFQQQIKKLRDVDWIIFVSPQAVQYSIAAIKKNEPALPSNVKLASIGESTANALQKAGLPGAVFPPQDWRTEGLLALPEFQQIASQKIAIISGLGGRELLAQTLKSRGAIVTQIVAYQRKLPKLSINEYIHQIGNDSLDIVVSTSHESLQNLLSIVGKSYWPDLFNTTLIVVSERIAIAAQKMGFKKIVIAKNASHEQILTAIEAIDKRNAYGR